MNMLLLDHAWFIQEVEKGQSQADQGELIDHDEVVARIENQVQEKLHRS